jgi:tetratricopeptide (TPR) repeat protein
MADALYKNGKFDEAAALFRSLGEDPKAPLAGPARFNLGNALYQKQEYPAAVQAYREALRTQPDDADTRRNLELALRALRDQEEQKKRQNQNQKQKQDEKDEQKQKPGEQNKQGEKQTGQQSPGPGQDKPRPQTEQEKADQRFRQETGMPRERAMQLLEALQENEKAEQKKRLAAQRAAKKGTKDW